MLRFLTVLSIGVLSLCCTGHQATTPKPEARLDWGGALYRPQEKKEKIKAAKLFTELEAILSPTNRDETRQKLESFTPFSEKVYDLGDAMEPEDTDRYLKLVAMAADRPEALEELLIGLSLHGSDEKSLPFFITEMNRTKEFSHAGIYEHVAGAAYNVHELDGVAAGYVMRSIHPIAITYKLSLLQDPKMFPEFRNMAYVSVAGSHDANALRAIREIRSRDSCTSTLPDGTEISLSANEDQAVLNAASDGLLRFLSRDPTAPWVVILPNAMAPFKFAYADRDVVIGTVDRKSPKWARSRKISFSRPYRDFNGKETKGDGPAILWKANRTGARVGIRGGLDDAFYDVELEKIAGVWYVIMAEMAWVA
jgi:hypothetical protein